MKNISFYFFLGLVFFSACKNQTSEQQTDEEIMTEDSLAHLDDIVFYSLDSLIISAQFYVEEGNEQCILFCHQAGFNKSEYHEIAYKLMHEGFNSLAIDQRSGGTITSLEMDNKNVTYERAAIKKLGTNFLDAEQDIIAAIDFLYEKCGHPIILWGSSYSASLALKVGANNDKVKAIVAFSPGEYFKNAGVILKDEIKDLNKSTFVTSSKEEAAALTDLISDLPSGKVVQFIPTEEGKHGSKALWEDHENNSTYWTAVMDFLKTKEEN